MGETGYSCLLDAAGDRRDRLEIAVRSDREAGLDDVDAHLVEEIGDFELFLQCHPGAGRLFAVAQSRVENDDAILVGADRGRRSRGIVRFGWST